jgi:hypothetical protein
MRSTKNDDKIIETPQALLIPLFNSGASDRQEEGLSSNMLECGAVEHPIGIDCYLRQ